MLCRTQEKILVYVVCCLAPDYCTNNFPSMSFITAVIRCHRVLWHLLHTYSIKNCDFFLPERALGDQFIHLSFMFGVTVWGSAIVSASSYSSAFAFLHSVPVTGKAGSYLYLICCYNCTFWGKLFLSTQFLVFLCSKNNWKEKLKYRKTAYVDQMAS